jgi:hypothetical protein
MRRAKEHADRVEPNWSDCAMGWVRIYALAKEEFICEDVRRYAEGRGLPLPPDGRAWGSVMMKASRAGLIQATDRIRNATDPKVHMNPSRIWRSKALA